MMLGDNYFRNKTPRATDKEHSMAQSLSYFIRWGSNPMNDPNPSIKSANNSPSKSFKKTS